MLYYLLQINLLHRKITFVCLNLTKQTYYKENNLFEKKNKIFNNKSFNFYYTILITQGLLYIYKNDCQILSVLLLKQSDSFNTKQNVWFFQSLVQHTLTTVLGREMLNIAPSAVRRIYAMPIVSIVFLMQTYMVFYKSKIIMFVL